MSATGTSSTRPASMLASTSTTKSATATSTGTNSSARCGTSDSTASQRCVSSAGRRTRTTSTAACSTGSPRVSGREVVKLDRTAGFPLYHQLARRIEGAIETGRLPPGSTLGNEILLAKRFGVSRPTMRHAIQTLVDDGLLVRKRGVGTQVVHGPIHRPIQLTSLHDDLEKRGESPQTVVLTNDWVAAGREVAAMLSVAVGEPVLHLRRVRLARHEPLAVLENYLPNDLAGIGDADLGSKGLYQAMRDAGIRLAIAKQRIAA